MVRVDSYRRRMARFVARRPVQVNWVARPPSPEWGDVEERPIELLVLHERTDRELVREMSKSMRAGRKIPMPWIGKDGFVLDGHHRIEAAAIVLGETASIPVIVKRRQRDG